MTSAIRPIRSEGDYEAALVRIEVLMDAEPDTAAADELEVLATLVELYEDERYPMAMPDPVTAIAFRMEQAGLTPRDLVPLLGSRPRVSEVLSGKRDLTLQMIRALHDHLGIPADVLLRRPGEKLPENLEVFDWHRFPIAAMRKAGWFGTTKQTVHELKESAEELMRDLIERAGGFAALPQALYRKNDTARHNAKTDPYALRAWCYQVLASARADKLDSEYRKGTMTKDWTRRLAALSAYAEGPRLARQHLGQHGIHLIYTPHLPRTHLDGAALLLPDGTPIVAVTLRYDRLDNFWFCLLHELAHVALHLGGEDDLFLDDLSLGDISPTDMSENELDADRWATEMLIPQRIWERSDVQIRASVMNVVALAQELSISPAIVAGRIRRERRNFRLLSQFVGNGEVRKHFDHAPAR